jgi:preprotein translocase subunit SecA
VVTIWDELVSSSCDSYPAELVDDIKRAYDEDLVDASYIAFNDVKRDLAMGKERVLAGLAEDRNHRLMDDAPAELRWWSSFGDAARESQSQPPADIRPAAMAVTQVKHAQPKTGRNDPCPCGSGKKYKKCCGA